VFGDALTIIKQRQHLAKAQSNTRNLKSDLLKEQKIYQFLSLAEDKDNSEQRQWFDKSSAEKRAKNTVQKKLNKPYLCIETSRPRKPCFFVKADSTFCLWCGEKSTENVKADLVLEKDWEKILRVTQ